ncbi:MAG TPA: Gfo/Idh/MocA family oxidoreductase [Planctomycetota bacterium]|jgi:predicted dehydrogenase
MDQKQDAKSSNTRRDFLKTSAVVAAGAAVATRLSVLPKAYAAENNAIRIGMIGSGQRGCGAIVNAITACPEAKVIAMADVFKDRLENSRDTLAKARPQNIDVTPERSFVGFDSYKELLKLPEVNYVILSTPPGFRSMHLRAAVEAGKNIFAEKPVAVDAPTARECFEVAELAKTKNLGIVCGTQRRHSKAYQEMIKRVQDGDIGQILYSRAQWLQGKLWSRKRDPKWSDLEFQLRDWLYFAWLSGDFIVEQHVHNIDVVNWAMGTHPVSAVSLAGRQVRIEPEYGHTYDHFATEFEYENGAYMLSRCRQIEDCCGDVSEEIIGTTGRAKHTDGTFIKGAKPWTFQGKDVDPYTQEHVDLIESIRAGKPLNELKACAESSFTAVMGRMSAYTGMKITWADAIKSKEKLMPEKLAMDMKLPVPDVAMPGLTEFK